MLDALPQDRVRHCVFAPCTEEALTHCIKCGRWYCLDHASDLEPTKHCTECLKVEDAALEVSAILDAEGVRHQGRVIRPVGVVFAQNSKLIHEMSEAELKEYITYYQQAVHDCERSLDYARITLGNALYVAADKQLARVKRETGEVVFLTPKRVAQAKARRVAKPLDEDKLIEFLMKTLTPDQIKAYLAKVKK